jgi:twitching motility protein PilT
MPKLGELDFSDLYVRIDTRDTSRYAPTPRRGSTLPRNMPVPAEFEPGIDLLRAVFQRQEHDDFALDLEDMRLRGSRCTLFGEQRWVALRRLPVDPPLLDELGFPASLVSEFRSWSNRGGLIIVGGATRAGKTTTAVALLTDYLRANGGVAVTVEDPVEYYLQGEHGDGNFCFQREVHEDDEWGEAVKAALRWAPRYIFLGEVRTPAAAKWLLRAATSGHLAMCTVHGGSINETLIAILQIAQSELGDTAPILLADGLCAVLHQKLINGRVHAEVLRTEPSIADPVRVAIRAGKLQQLGTQIEQQAILRDQGMSRALGSDDADSSGAGMGTSRPAAAKPIAARPAQTAGQPGATQGQGKPKPPAPPPKKFLGIF